MAKKHNLTDNIATQIVDLVFEGFAGEIKKGGRIEIRGFGSFSVRGYETYTGRNPKTGDFVEEKPKRLPFFKVCKELKETVDSKG